MLFGRPPEMSPNDSQCGLPSNRFELLEFCFVVDSGSGPEADKCERPVSGNPISSSAALVWLTFELSRAETHQLG